MILHFGAVRATDDVDAVVLRGNPAGFRRASRRLADDFGLDRDWLNDAAKAYVAMLPPEYRERLTEVPVNHSHLRLFALARVDQAALKIVALREQDLEDLELLLHGMSADEQSGMIRIAEHFAAVRPDWALKMRLFLEELGWPTD